MGEEKRRRQSGEYPTEGGDPGYGRFHAKLRRLFPKLEEREIGLSWMRAADPNPGVPSGLPEDVPVMPGHVVMHLLYDDGSLNGALPVEQIDEAIEAWRSTGLSRVETRQGIFDEVALNRHRTEDAGSGIMTGLVWLAFTSGAAPTLRQLAAQGFLRITYTVETYLDAAAGGKRAINFRLAGSDQRDPPMSIPLSEQPPTVAPESPP